MIRLLLVEDSVTQREILRRMIEGDSGFTVIAEAKNGREAVAFVEKYRPDVVLMDLHMPDMDGVMATREIMRRTPVPIVVASASLKQQEVDLGLEALQAGAVAVVEKPEGAVLLHLEKIAPLLRSELLIASKAKVKRRGLGSLKSPPVEEISQASSIADVIGICASTGGPPVLVDILGKIPRPYPIPILLVQHISANFVPGFARWLGDTTGQRVCIAGPYERMTPGIWVSPGGKHLCAAELQRIVLKPPFSSSELHCPSGNALFSSLAQVYGSRAIGVLLTGMGDDGAEGLLELRRRGGRTLVQDEASSLIYGMPRAARERGAADSGHSPSELIQILTLMAENQAVN
ncbi:chemotaxis protein CheB [Planctomicrobium piriforme]|uniref:protein-glutamate methylesterase n=1 Tax=Planctomicrobium piriforme TaxID=1576369 RepID=A0A1I3QHK7_9PLAN|nr:chemotaxis protein CheB [Planctomicrobium piriforme]SFJ33644.1 two-component system, chemotaxis family, response regulator CheB [Planctomicrobium piriforme]